MAYALALAAILFSQPIVSQTQSQSQPNANQHAENKTKPNGGTVNCTNNGTYVNSKGQTVQRPENCSGPPTGATAQCRDVYIGKESDKHWEEGEEFESARIQTIEYKRKGYAITTDEQLAQIATVPKRELMRRGINQHTLEKIYRKVPVRANKIYQCLGVLNKPNYHV